MFAGSQGSELPTSMVAPRNPAGVRSRAETS